MLLFIFLLRHFFSNFHLSLLGIVRDLLGFLLKVKDHHEVYNNKVNVKIDRAKEISISTHQGTTRERKTLIYSSNSL